MNKVIIVLASCIMMAPGIGCAGAPREKASAEKLQRAERSPRNPSTQRPENKPAAAEGRRLDPSRMNQNFQRSDLVFIGRPIELLPSTGIWAGVFPSYQAVRYQVVRVLKGGLQKGAEVTVGHLLVHGAPTVDPAIPRLSASLFAPGRVLLVFARQQGDKIDCLNEKDGVVEATEDLLRGLSWSG